MPASQIFFKDKIYREGWKFESGSDSYKWLQRQLLHGAHMTVTDMSGLE